MKSSSHCTDIRESVRMQDELKSSAIDSSHDSAKEKKESGRLAKTQREKTRGQTDINSKSP